MSKDPVRKHARFKQKHGFTYPLIADTEHVVAELYGVWAEKKFMGRTYWGMNRTTFVIDADGRIARIFEKVNPIGHAKEVAEAVTELTRTSR